MKALLSPISPIVIACSLVMLFSNLAVADTLRGEWKLDEGTGNIAYDTSGNGYDGNLTPPGGPTWITDGYSGKALRFDGVDDYVEIPNTSNWNFADGFTLDMWVRSTSYNPNSDILSKHISGIGAGYLVGIFGYGEVGFYVNDNVLTTGTQGINDGAWHHIIASYVNGYQYLSVDLQQFGPREQEYNLFSPANIRIGGAYAGVNTGGFVGDIDEVRIYEIPEPATLSLLSFAGLMILRRRPR